MHSLNLKLTPEQEYTSSFQHVPGSHEASPGTSSMVLRSRSLSCEPKQKPTTHSSEYMATAVIKLSRFDVDVDNKKPLKVTAELLQSLPKSKYAARPG